MHGMSFVMRRGQGGGGSYVFALYRNMKGGRRGEDGGHHLPSRRLPNMEISLPLMSFFQILAATLVSCTHAHTASAQMHTLFLLEHPCKPSPHTHLLISG